MSTVYKEGDKVSFIDQKMDGVIKTLKSNGKLLVETDDGFDITADPSELVLIESYIDPIDNSPAETLADNPADQSQTIDLNKCTDENTITFLTQSYEANKVLSGNLRCALVNNLDSTVLYNAYKLNPEPLLLSEGRIPPAQYVIISETSREEIEGFGEIYIQYLVCSMNDIAAPGKFRLKPKPPGLEDAVDIENDTALFFTQKVIYTELTVDDYDLSLLAEKYSKEHHPDVSAKGSGRPKRTQQERTSYDMVVDLHIEELVDDLTRYDTASMLEIQRNELIRQLNDFINSKAYKLVVIHGVGKGVLKKAVYEEVAKYSDLKCAPADPSLYGSGATEILFT